MVCLYSLSNIAVLLRHMKADYGANVVVERERTHARVCVMIMCVSNKISACVYNEVSERKSLFDENGANNDMINPELVWISTWKLHIHFKTSWKSGQNKTEWSFVGGLSDPRELL